MCTCSPPCGRGPLSLRAATTSRTSGFTLIELLSSLGVIALLAAMLLPTLSSARESANRTKCLSNLRQLAVAFTMYLGENGGRFPRPAQHLVPLPEDWIYHQPGRDAEGGAIARYAGKPFNAALYRCPSDDVDGHVGSIEPFTGADLRYRYSYAVNEHICRIVSRGPTLRLGEVRNASEKILLIDESAATIDDGGWAWQPSQGAGMNVLSNRHDRKSENAKQPDDGRGNAAFVDSHAEYIDRERSFDARHYDPAVR